MAGDVTYTLPDAPSAGDFLTVDAGGNMSWGSVGGGGDMLKATYDTGSNNIVDNAEALNGKTASTTAVDSIVLRDASGDFTANDITANSLIGNVTGNLTGNASGSAASFTGALVGDVSGTQGATVVDTVGGKTDTEVATSVDDTIAATNANTASTIVKRDASGDFSANMITSNVTGALTGNADTATSATSFSGALVGDVTGNQGATVVDTVGGKTDTEVATSVDDTIAATNAATVSTIVKRDGSGNFIANQIDANSAMRLKDNDGGDHYATVKAAATMAGDVTYTLPDAPSAGDFLTVDAGGNMSWGSVGGG
ncbi:MAG: hypothetical protein GY822_29155, partial [Deltaproteobacteria bacterium]|nr:hypothetical protein [Deltaproteobacteria bacterium]